MKHIIFFSILILSLLISYNLQGQAIDMDPDKITIDSTIFLNGNGVANGGQIIIKSKDGENRVRLFSQLNTTTNLGGYIDLYNASNIQTVIINGGDLNDGGRIILYDDDGAQKITLNSNYNNNGDGRVITDEIEIKGGSDLAEMFDITNEESIITPGLLVSLDPSNPGKLKISTEAYDKKIAGILSGANGIKPGILMSQDQTVADGENLVTLSGRTYVKANTTNGSIKIGDSITSSKVEGEAMRATKKKKSRGAIVGKALTGLEDGSGYILVLVSFR